MKIKERMMAVLRHEEPDTIPFSVYTFLISRGEVERELRNMGLCLVESAFGVYGINTPHVKTQTTESIASLDVDNRFLCVTKQKHMIDRAFITPVGKLNEKYKVNYAAFEWPAEWSIKDVNDYEIAEYILDDTEFFPRYDDFVNAEKMMGNDGIVEALAPKSPIQSMLYDLLGYKTFSLHYHLHRKEFNEFYQFYRRKQLEMYDVIAESPAEVILLDDNITGVVTDPRIFEEYCMPFYDEAAQLLHNKDKIFMVHLDGKLNCLRDLIAKTSIDVIEAFTPPPIGDVTIEEAMTIWKGKILWTNFPATAYLEAGLERVADETVSMLRSAAPGRDFAMGVTEDIGNILSHDYMEVLRTIARQIVEHGEYPLAKA
jgi:hypothetical protein